MSNRARITALALESAVCASALVVSLDLVMRAFIRWFPYHDQPMIPKPFFLFALFPGYLAGEQFDDPRIGGAVFYLANVLTYSTLFFLIHGFVARLLHEHRSH